ncbi:diguanylate phosphodiesterase [Aeromonas hydrophila]|nr:diguanylate phosphodiesterase [Aeromonas hydrophila]
METRQQADYLKRKGVDYLQGYLFGRPLPLRDFQAALAQPQVDRTAQLASA